MRTRLLPATLYDLETLCSLMRQSDRDEIEFNAKATGRYYRDWSIRREMIDQFPKFPHWAMLHDGDLLAICGIAPMPCGLGAIWLLGTDLMDVHWRETTRLARQFIAATRSDYLAVGNVVPAHMTDRIRWLKHLGFDISQTKADRPFSRHVAFWSQPANGPEGWQRLQ